MSTDLVILSEAKDLLSWQCARHQVLRFAQDDKFIYEDSRFHSTSNRVRS